MIPILKPPKTPEVLITKGADKTREDKVSYDQHSREYRSGRKTFKPDKRIYGHKSVKHVLMQSQHHKCCYCESKFRSTHDADIEHYRPKTAVKQSVGADKLHPGYYWLAYRWDNLLVSCTDCNRRHKGMLFPLVDNSVRARSHRDDIRMEQPLFINPASDDPRNHIRFHGPEPVHKTEVGRVTIESLGLRSPALHEERLTRFRELIVLREIIEQLRMNTDSGSQAVVRRIKQFLVEAKRPESKFSAMAQDFVEAAESLLGDE